METNMNVIAIEIHEVPKKFVADETKVETTIKKQRSKRIKKLSENEKMKGRATEIPHVAKYIAGVETEIEIPKKKTKNYKRIKKVNESTAEEHTPEVTTYEAGKQNLPDEKKKELQSALRKVEKYMLASQTIAHLQDEHPRVVAYNLSLSYLHVLKTVPDCIYCSTKRFEHEPPTFCCASRYIKLATTEAPSELYEMFVVSTADTIDFRKNICAYDSIFAFTSFGVNLDKEIASARKGVYTFRAQGQFYHDLPSLVPRDNVPCYVQLYFFDTDNELTNRISKVKEGILSDKFTKKIKQIMEGNPYAQIFCQLKDQSSFHNFQLCIAASASLDQRVYNSPSVNQVAATWIDGNNPNIPFEREIIGHEHSGNKHRVKHYFGCYDPLQYPLLFPRGEGGCHQRIRKQHTIQPHTRSGHSPTFISADAVLANEDQDVCRETKGDVSCREYYCYKLQLRETERSVLLLCGRLLQQLETTRLEYFRNKQSNFRREVYQGIVDSVSAREYRGDRIGQRILLPSSFIGVP
ncbi:hypothetical protein H5410_002291 [Solanum commersonii]|uniref:Helitron helicase-like domain-containing protein n=1 Tax=Solanum commersonii TaxID=4109 RepID=A0A9J6B1H4_SOLCO|nr:hypothetical protein H5410_002291 [Solanum commersonii]